MSCLFGGRSLNRKTKGSPRSKSNNHFNNTDCGAPIKSPRSKFQRNNSNPLPKTISGATSVQETPKKIDDSRQQRSLSKLLKFIRPNTQKKNNQSNHGDLLKEYEHNSVELNKSSKAPPRQQNVSQLYEKSINKHGDVVEYAVPYSELQSPLTNDFVCVSEARDNLLDQPTSSGRLVDINASSIGNPDETTDFDKSSVGYMSLNQMDKGLEDCSIRDKDVLSELDSLRRWSQKIMERSPPDQEPTIDTNVHIITCKPREIQSNRKVLRNTIALPLHFSSGFFRKTPVALRHCFPLDLVSVGLVEAIERDYDILKKVKHSNIILLMAVSCEKKSLYNMTLVLESVDCTLNYYLHQMNTTLSIVESISVVQQIASAALYLQECGYIHSNISSHNIPVRKIPWCVKLSSFELTTDVDFVDTKAELMIKYRQKSSITNQCTDTPKYDTVPNADVSLKDQYRQMSKLLPILKCSPNAQHTYLSMLSKHLAYDTNYRQHLSLHNFQAPELLTTKLHFVFPTTKADVYSLCLLLWEMLNNCVPFVVYSKVDMERMIEAKKMSFPMFEQDRCQPFKNIFKIGFALNPENRTIDLHQLSTLLEDVKFRIQNGIKDVDQEQNMQRSDVYSDAEQHQMNRSISVSTIHSLNSIDFNRRLIEKETTSTMKRQIKKSPQTFIKKKACQQLLKLFSSKDAVNNDKCKSFLSNSQNKLENISRELSLNEIREGRESNFNSIEAPLPFKENELQSNNSLQKEADRVSSNGNTEWRNTNPETVDFDVADENPSDNSKSCRNLFDGSTSNRCGRNFHSKIVSPPSNGSLIVGEYQLPDTLIARKNKIRRNAWLANQLNLSNKEIDRPAMENTDEPLNDNNQLKVSIRIVHKKVTPKKVYSGNPLVKSEPRMTIYDSNTEISTRSTAFTNICNNNDRTGNVDSNYSANYPIKDYSCKELVELKINADQPTSTDRPIQISGPLSTDRITERNRTLPNFSTLSMSQIKCTDSMSRSSNVNQEVSSLGNMFLKREFNTRNRSHGEGANNVTPKWQSVRDKILKFEKRNILSAQPSLPLTTATEFGRNCSKSVAESNDIKLTEAPTVIKRTMYSESTVKVSSLDLASLDNQKPLFDQLNLSGQKLTTQVTLNMRQIRRRSSDSDDTDRAKIEGTTGIRHTVCGRRKGLDDCKTKMSSDELRTLQCQLVAESSLNATYVLSQRHCEVRLNSPETRSIEDLYIDDDFDQELGIGANIELQSDSSDFLNFNIISDIFNDSKADT